MEWLTPRGRTRAVRGQEAFIARLRELDADEDARRVAARLGLSSPVSR